MLLLKNAKVPYDMSSPGVDGCNNGLRSASVGTSGVTPVPVPVPVGVAAEGVNTNSEDGDRSALECGGGKVGVKFPLAKNVMSDTDRSRPGGRPGRSVGRIGENSTPIGDDVSKCGADAPSLPAPAPAPAPLPGALITKRLPRSRGANPARRFSR